MSDPILTAEIAELVREAGKVPAEVPVGPETLLVEDLGVDSLDLVSVFLLLQDRYGVDVADDDVPGLLSVGDVASYVERRVESAAA